MRGLRTQEGSKFNKFFQLVQEEAAKRNSVFFLDSGDGNEFSTESLEGENLTGWLIPDKEAAEFERTFLEWGETSDKWTENFCWAIWENAESPTIRFEHG